MIEAEIVRAAQDGDTAAFAVLARRHLAGMRATAIAVLGYNDDAEDAVQDAMLIAMRRLGQLRDPDAAGSWLTAIVRNNARLRLRAVARTVPVADPEQLLPVATAGRPDEGLERAGQRDWVRHAVDGLPEPIRETVVLRYFTEYSSYRQIAEVCGVPVGTVRSRLRDGRRALTRTLLATADSYPERAAGNVWENAAATIAAGARGDYATMLGSVFHRDARLTLEGRPVGGPRALVGMMEFTYGAGVQARLREATASRDLLVWETDFVNPPDDPEHCPPGMIWVHSLRDGRTQHLKMAYARAG
ncbi:RNA polymerase sigma-70 factor (ECF subfamily) [Catenuloplanes nepalensis]|uniref:RNA polymerase sigma-70 factor (ECF subfamily) n=1 Tax=Catenuloplanes nepalensis TaxID=587533 RepID=A0ABT9MMV6_9ACTN|nr:RNA polymerase sigma factor [Catenuloplanes nepalensis]MDP9792773.1 RNA polymerase sigma-70 factor (ECF subfamily) [Catenuloplanes nepalensis]